MPAVDNYAFHGVTMPSISMDVPIHALRTMLESSSYHNDPSNQDVKSRGIATIDSLKNKGFNYVRLTSDESIQVNLVDIMWLLYESGISRYQISQGSGISESTLSRLYNQKTRLSNLALHQAGKLSLYAGYIRSLITDDF